ncbi:calcium-binding protein [Sphingomonas sp. NSE70-1]|uniref:Calcium-binding protein n=1 Tax=Sphingomonas caseinilyticus TaxID=2908205 RepID=A0ABT0RV87_9SPHN|nr:calcium-binding protein [Sphingomonas caseinilyticus]MCL6698923.1 calcium-binding protein [Sphingomonas caseinilyticus]
MKKFVMVATALLAGTAFAQTAPVAQPAPAVTPTPTTPMTQPMRDRVTTRAEAVQMAREHFGEMDSNKDGTVTTAEIDASRAKRFEDFKARDGGHAMAMGDPNAAFDRLDANKDSYISREEFTKAREERVERREIRREERKNSPKDGKEVRRHVMKMHGPGGGMLAMADTNKDGQVTQAEAEALALQHFDRMDSNKDGQITPEERRAGRQIIIQQRREEKKSGS